jgi:alpha-glucosidase
MRLTLPTITGLGNSGFPFVGVDVGGYKGSPTPELLTRWTELGTFVPIDRNHAEKGSRDREPWVDGPEHLAIRKHFIEERYHLLPYIYTSMEQTSRTGVPLMRSLFIDFPDDSRMVTADADSEFMFGDDLLVAPVVKEFLGGYEAILPKGIWYDFWTGDRIESDEAIQLTPTKEMALNSDKKKLQLNPSLDHLPVFARAGAIIPEQPLVQNTDEVPQGPLTLRVFPGSNCSGSIYADDGKTFAYRQVEFYRNHFTCETTANSLHVVIEAPEGKYTPWWKEYSVKVAGTTKKPRSVSLDGGAVTNFQYDQAHKTLVVNVPASQHASVVDIQY